MRGVARRWRGLVATLCALVVVPLLALAVGAGCGAAANGRDATSTAPGSAISPQDDAPSLPLGELAGARIVAGFNGTSPPAALREGIREGHVAGVVLYAENLPSRADAQRLIAGLQSIPRPPAMRDPLLILVDQEGGLVKRIDGAPYHSAEEIGARGAAFARREGRRTARTLRGVGVNVDIAPSSTSRAPARRSRKPTAATAPPRRPSPRSGLLSLRGCRAATLRRPPSTSPASARPRTTPMSRSAGSACRRRACARSTRRPTATTPPRAGTW